MYEYIKPIQPFFHSLREIHDKVSLDIKIPLTWTYNDIIPSFENIRIQIQDTKDKFTLISLINTADINGYSSVLSCALQIILQNREKEYKQKLFNEKVNELKMIFDKESLTTLQDLNFFNKNGQEYGSSNGVVEEGDAEGQTRIGEDQTENDIRVETVEQE